MNAAKLQKERTQIFDDFWHNRLPARLPVDMPLYHQLYIEYSGKDLIEAQYDYSVLKDSAEDFCNEIYSDTCPLRSRPKLAAFHQLLGAKTFVMSSAGIMQHPETTGMYEDEYDELINDPLSFIIGKVLPRQYSKLDNNNPMMTAKAILTARASQEADNNAISDLSKPLIEKYGYYPGSPRTASGSTRAPFDYIADVIRGFSAVSTDLRRNRKKIADACDAVYPLMFRIGLPKKPDLLGTVNIALHMPTYMRSKDFEEVFLPSFLRLIRNYAALGVRINAFCEDDYTRFIDYLQDFPANALLRFETADPALFKNKLGHKFFLGGFFPVNLLRTGTKEQCLDKIKEVADIMLPGGGYLFGLDKNPMTLKDVRFENLKAVTEYMRDYAVYENRGESFGTPLNTEGYVCDLQSAGSYESKYKFSWEEFKKENIYAPDSAREKFERLDEDALNFFINLLMT